MFQLKTISPAGIPGALAKAERYRLLNEPRDAESICRDVLRVDPENQEAVRALIFALTEQFGRGVQVNVTHAQEALPRVKDEYERALLAGIICERWAKSQLREGAPGYVVYGWFEKAMSWYEQAEPKSPPDQEDAKLRYNACARMIKRSDHVRPRAEDSELDALLQDDVPMP